MPTMELFIKRLIIASLFTSAFFGAQAETSIDQARVRSAEPQYKNIKVPRQACSSHWVEEKPYLLENNTHRGPYDTRPYEASQREVQYCRTVYETQKRITGYRVADGYRGQDDITFMQTNPGKWLPVRVSVDPIVL